MVSLIYNYIDLSGYPIIHRLFTILSISGQICLCNLEAQQIDYFKLSFTNKYYRPSVSVSFNQKLWYTKAFVLVSWQCQITRKFFETVSRISNGFWNLTCVYNILSVCTSWPNASSWFCQNDHSERFQWQKGLTFKRVWSPLSYKQIGMPVIGKRLQQNQCRKVLKPKKPRDLRGLKATHVAGPKKEILLKHQGTKGNWKSRASNDLEHLSFVMNFVHFSSRLATTKSFCSTSLTESILSQSCSPKHHCWQ